jgi:hypothetical protein
MNRLVFMLEEPSMKTLLEELLPRLFPALDFLCIAHEGKSDLEKSIPRKLRAWAVPGDRFVVVRDNDGGDCLALKDHLSGVCQSAGRTETLIRIVCQELEAWYLGQPDAIAVAFEICDAGLLFEKVKLALDSMEALQELAAVWGWQECRARGFAGRGRCCVACARCAAGFHGEFYA